MTRAPSDQPDENGLIDEIIRDVAELPYNPLPGQSDDEMRITADELRRIVADGFDAARTDGFTAGYQEALEAAADKAREMGRAISKGSVRRAGPADQGEITATAILEIPHAE